ncbi:hypothetical protein FRC09_002681 [Ceratobasidium sp. 395]|nr:hypothetical protein FRC09_002681 [Ceratobasidium sp. 395]
MRLDTTFLVGVWLEALFYGIYVAAFLVCLGLFRSRARSVGRALPIWLVALFVLATAHCALSLSAALDAFVRQTYPVPFPYPPAPSPSPSAHPGANGAPTPMPGPPSPSSSTMPRAFRDPVFYIANRALPTNLASLGVYAGIVLVSDLMLLYRLLVMYRYKFVWALGPAVLTLASFAISMVVVTKYSHIDLTLSKDAILAELEAVDPWVPPVYAISFLASLSIAALMMVRTSFTSSPKSTLPAFARAGRRHTRQTSLTAGDGFVFDMDERTGPVPSLPSNSGHSGQPSELGVRRSTISRKWVMLAGLVESGAIAPVFMLAALILYVVQDGQETLLVPLLAPIAALVPTLQIIQIQLGLDSSARSSSPASSGTTSPGTGTGRSPYLVPAPRYRDSFSSSEDEGQDRKVDLLDRNSSQRGRAQAGTGEARLETGARRWGVWAWRGSGGSGSGSHGSGSGSGSRSHARSLSGTGSSGSANNNRQDPIVALPMQDLSSSRPTPTQAHNKDDTIWERIKLDSDPSPSLTPKPTPAPTSPPKRNTLRKSGTVMKEMISKPVPVAADFPPTTAAIPSTTVPALPSFTVTSPGPSQGALAKVPSLSKMASGNLGRKTSGGLDRKTSGNLGRTVSGKDKDKDKDGGEHKYHYRMRPRERTTSHLAAYLSAQAREQEGNSSSGHLPPVSSSGHPGSNIGHPGPGSNLGHPGSSNLGHPGSNSGHANLMSLPSTVPTSPASGFTSLAPNTNPFRYDAATPPPLQLPPPQPQLQSQHKRSYSDVQRGDAPSPQPGIAGIGLAGAHRAPLTFPFAPDPEVGNVPRWGVLPGAPYIPGLGGGMRKVERDVSPAPGLQQDYARARDEVLRQMQRERGAMSDDESVYSTQPLSAVGSGWRGFPAGGR